MLVNSCRSIHQISVYVSLLLSQKISYANFDESFLQDGTPFNFLMLFLTFSCITWLICIRPYEVVRDTTGFSGKIFFCPKRWEKEPKIGQKQGFLNLLKSLVINFYWICSVMRISIAWCAPAQSHICSWDMGQMFSANQIAWLFNPPYL